jgi:alpha-tubulin suppressor-like RCC1 family protein
LGDNTTANRSSPIHVPGSNWVAVSAGLHSLAVGSDGTLYAWGDNAYGKLGLGDTVQRTSPTQLSFSFALLPLVSTMPATNIMTTGATLNGNLTGLCKLNAFLAVAAGTLHTVALRSDGTLWAWGGNTYGQLGDNTTEEKHVPTQVGTNTNWVAVAAGGEHSLALRSDGTLWAWGENGNGQLGNNTVDDRHVPTQVGINTNWVAVAAGNDHSVALRSDGTLWAWGYNGNGQLGNNTVDDRHVPTQVGINTNWVAVAAGSYHTVALRSDGTLWAWGYNGYGQLGNNTVDDRHVPTQVDINTNWVAVDAGSFHTVALRSDGTLWAWGDNGSGQLGNNAEDDEYVPTQVDANTNWVAVASRSHHSLALRSDGTLWVWGLNSSGQLGLGYTDPAHVHVPTQVGANMNWAAVDAGSYHSVALRSDGTLWAWGDNSNGRLGLGDTTRRTIPDQVEASFTPSYRVRFQWGLTTSYGSTTDNQTRGSTGTGSFSAAIPGLSPGATYNFRACVSSPMGDVYGYNQSFTTLIPPSVTTGDSENVTNTAARLNGNLTSLGSAGSVTVSFEWGTLSGSYPKETTGVAKTVIGTFYFDLGSLDPSTTYYYRAKAMGDSTVYGVEKSFTTLTTPPTVTTNDATSIATTSATLNGELTSMGTAGSVTVSFEWKVSGGSYTPIDVGVKDSIGAFSVELPGLSSGTTYYYKAKAVGDSAVYGAEKNFTTLISPAVTTNDATSIATTSATLNGELTSLGTAGSVTVSFEWKVSGGSYTPIDVVVKDSIGAFSVELPGLSSGTTYYYRAKAVGDSTVYGAEKNFTTLIPPAVTTNDASSVVTNSARMNGNLTSLGTAGSVTVSFVWGTTSGGPYPNETAGQAMTDNGTFYCDLAGLSLGTTYYYQAKAVGNGTSFGAELSFVTIDVPPQTPGSVSPEQGTTTGSFTPTLTSSAFSDRDSGDTHAASQWQVTRISGDYSNLAYDSDADPVNLTTVAVPTLPSLGTYYWRVRHKDNQGNWSAYSPETSFIIVDASPPTVTPEGNDYVIVSSKEVVTLSGTIADSISAISHVYYRVGDTDWQEVTFSDDDGDPRTVSYAFKTSLSKGENEVVIKAVDAAENETITDPVNITVTSGGSKAWVIVVVVVLVVAAGAVAGLVIWKYRAKIKAKATDKVSAAKEKLSE